MSITCDVLVVGAGPAGSSAARAAAKNGLKTILIEEDKEIGNPVQCAEGIGAYLIPYMPFAVPKKLLKWKINGMYFWADDIAIKRSGRTWSGYSINRKKWDQWLAFLAHKSGAKIFTNTKLISFEFGKNHVVEKAIAIKNGKKIIFKPKYIIGADGINSMTLNLLNQRKNDSIGYVKSYEMKNLKLKYPKLDQLFFGDFAPRAYAYIFPLSKTTANIGVGTINRRRNLDELFDKFTNLSCVKKQISNGKIVSEKSGEAPIGPLSSKIVYENVFLVGDAANQNIKPFIEGNIPGIICGTLLGEFINNVFKEKINTEFYEDFIGKKFDLIENSQIFADFVYGESKIEPKIFNLILLGLMSELIHPDEKNINRYVNRGYDFLKNHILKNGGFIEK